MKFNMGAHICAMKYGSVNAQLNVASTPVKKQSLAAPLMPPLASSPSGVITSLPSNTLD